MKEVEIDVSPFSLVLWPVSLPVGGFKFLLEQLRDIVNEELYDPATVRQHLLELQMQYEMGEVEEEQYRVEWTALTERLAMLSDS
jgi:hypothetical protein